MQQYAYFFQDYNLNIVCFFVISLNTTQKEKLSHVRKTVGQQKEDILSLTTFNARKHIINKTKINRNGNFFMRQPAFLTTNIAHTLHAYWESFFATLPRCDNMLQEHSLKIPRQKRRWYIFSHFSQFHEEQATILFCNYKAKF